MASITYIHYVHHQPEIVSGSIHWVPVRGRRVIDGLPQILWENGSSWREANVFALEMCSSGDVKLNTVQSLHKHLHHYANWLEQVQIDWRHFPQAKADRVLVRYRGALIDARNHGELSPSTTTARMNAVIRFYRYAAARNLVSREAPKWQDKPVVVRFFDTAGFERTLNRITTDISIPNRAIPGTHLEGGLLPLSSQQMTELLQFAKAKASEEVYLMLMLGFFTGARVGTITSLTVKALHDAVRDPMVPGMWMIRVGPDVGIATKFDVSGHLMIPDQVMTPLKAYATSRRHLDRVIRTTDANKPYLFLTRHNQPYKVIAVDREIFTLRRTGQAAGLLFMQKFKFHQTRATFGTWLMSICLENSSPKAAIEFVKRAMLHKNEATTFGYIKFIENTKAKIDLANAFTQAFLCLQSSRMEGEINAQPASP